MVDEMFDPTEEVKAIGRVAEALRGLDRAAAGRVLKWAADAMKVDIHRDKTSVRPEKASPDQAESVVQNDVVTGPFESVADFFSTANPRTDAERALAVGYWHQVLSQQPDFDAQTVNAELKNLGHGVGNITMAFNELMRMRPQLAIQTKKTGTSKQARKRYKLTMEGIRRIKTMLQGGGTETADE